MRSSFSFSITALLISAIGFSQDSVTNDHYYVENDTVKKVKKGGVLQEVTINPYQKNQVTVLRSGIKPMDLPQSIQVIGSSVIEQQQAVRLSEVVKNANGVYVGTARGGAQESFWSRGYDMSANNMFKNGFRFNGGSIPEVSSLEKVEILKGGAALLYGNVAPGGIMNMVTKTPLFKKGGEFTIQAGSYDFYKPSLDIYGPISNSIAYRFIGSYEKSGSFRDVVERERYYINPSFVFKISNKTEILLQGDYLNDDWTPDFGTGAIGQQVADVPRDRYLGASWSNGNTVQTTVSALLNHHFNSIWKLNFNASFQNYDRSSEATERILPAANGDWARPLGKNKAVEQILGQQLSLQGSFNTGKIKHQLFTGIDAESAFGDAYTFRFLGPSGSPVTTYDTVNIFDPSTYAAENEAPVPVSQNTQIIKTQTNRYGIYAQDLISLGSRIKVLAGIRYSTQETKPVTYNMLTNAPGVDGTIRNDRAFSPKVGIVYQPSKSISLFTSYSNSFTPNTGTDIFGAALEPSIIDQYEVGIKNEFWNGMLATNVTAYQIVNSNLSQIAEFDANGAPNTNTSLRALSGETTSMGVEIDIVLKPTKTLNLMAGYSYNDMQYTKTTGLTGSFIEGNRLVRTPQNTANLSAFYTVPSGKLRGFSIGTIANYIGQRLGGFNNTVGQTVADRTIPLEGYATIDVSLGYNWNKFSLLCKLSNITNELNYTVHENYSINPIAPRQVLASLKYKF